MFELGRVGVAAFFGLVLVTIPANAQGGRGAGEPADQYQTLLTSILSGNQTIIG